MEKIIGRFVDDRKAQRLKEKSLLLEACAVVAGHTYKRVKFVHFVNLNSLTHLSSYLAVLCDCMSWLASVFGLPGFLHFLCFLVMALERVLTGLHIPNLINLLKFYCLRKCLRLHIKFPPVFFKTIELLLCLC